MLPPEYRTSGTISLPLASTCFLVSKTASMLASVTKSRISANGLPGHSLRPMSSQREVHKGFCAHRLPVPKTYEPTSSFDSSPRKRSGLNVSGSFQRAGSCVRCLSWWIRNHYSEEHMELYQTFGMTIVPAGMRHPRYTSSVRHACGMPMPDPLLAYRTSSIALILPAGIGGPHRSTSDTNAFTKGRCGLSAYVGRRLPSVTASSSACARRWISGCRVMARKKVRCADKDCEM